MSTQTPYYGLYKWEGTDPVSRTEMNHNFEVLEQNLYGKQTYFPLFSHSVTQSAQLVSFDLSEINWNEYHEVVVEVWYAQSDKSSATIYVNKNQNSPDETYGSVMVPPSNTTTMTTYTNGLGSMVGYKGRITFYCHQHDTAPITTDCASLGHSRTYRGWNTNINYTQLSTLDIYCYSRVPAGVNISIWGVK